MADKDKKVTNEKPVSLFPLDFKEAVSAVLKVKPESKEKLKKKQNKKKSSA
jgi:hypothetical protein